MMAKKKRRSKNSKDNKALRYIAKILLGFWAVIGFSLLLGLEFQTLLIIFGVTSALVLIAVATGLLTPQKVKMKIGKQL